MPTVIIATRNGRNHRDSKDSRLCFVMPDDCGHFIDLFKLYQGSGGSMADADIYWLYGCYPERIESIDENYVKELDAEAIDTMLKLINEKRSPGCLPIEATIKSENAGITFRLKNIPNFIQDKRVMPRLPASA